MARIQEVPIPPRSIRRFEAILGADGVEATLERARHTRELLGARRVWNVNSTAVGGGVAEMLASLLGYPRDAGIDARWLVIEGTSEFFRITKRLHHALHGSPGDGSPLDEAAREIYELVLQENADELVRVIEPGDVVILHDPQTAGLAPALRRHGALVIWRCHIGSDVASEEAEHGWAFLRPYLQELPAVAFTRQAYVPPGIDSEVLIVPPSIDPFSPKSEHLDGVVVRQVLGRAGLIEGDPGHPVTFVGSDGETRTVDRRAHIVCEDEPPPADVPLVVQVSRWDPLKDHVGVVEGFVRAWRAGRTGDAHLVLAGPEVTAVSDDPEAATVLEAVIHERERLPDDVRARVHLASLPTADVVENASIVNALQTHAAVVVQKSLREGFGLTVTEAMWKGRPLIASAVGGILDQVEHERHGLLLDDPTDLDAFAEALGRLLGDPAFGEQLGHAAQQRVSERFLPVRHLMQYAELIEGLLERTD